MFKLKIVEEPKIRGTRDQTANIHWIIKKAIEFQKNIYFCLMTMSKPLVNEAEVDVFQEPPCFLHNPTNVGNLIWGSSAFSKSSFNIWNFTAHILLKPGLENFEHYFARV